MEGARRLVGLAVIFGFAAAVTVVLRAVLPWNPNAQEEPPRQVAAPAIPLPDKSQLAAMADGYVSREEMIAALNRAADCMEAEGLVAVRPGHPQLEGNLVLMRFSPPGVDPESGADAFRRCSEQHSAAMSSKYQVQLEKEGRAAPRPE